jgi:hypothetical protein
MGCLYSSQTVLRAFLTIDTQTHFLTKGETKMAYEVRAGQGSAFVNRNKTEAWHADYQGEIMLPNGDIHYLDVKHGHTKAGDNWFAVKIGKQKQPKQQQQQQDNPYAQDNKPALKAVVKPSFANNDDDVPF